jgi:hypothetical protein
VAANTARQARRLAAQGEATPLLVPQSAEPPAPANGTDAGEDGEDGDAWDPAAFWVKVTLTFHPLTLTLTLTVSRTHALPYS